MKRSNVLRLSAAALVAVGAALVAPASSWGAPLPCSVVDHGSHTHYSDLQTAIDNASDGGRLAMKGSCHGNFGIVSKALTIAGHRHATLDANGHGTVLTISSGSVTLRGITITGGSTGYNGGGVSIDAASVLTLRNGHVTGNSAGNDGGGVYNQGALVLAHSAVTGNTAGLTGGGVYNASGGTLILKGKSSVSGNQPNDLDSGS